MSDALSSIMARTSIPEWELAFRLLVAIVLGALIGWER